MKPLKDVSYIVVRIDCFEDSILNLKKITHIVQTSVAAHLGNDGRCVSLGTTSLHGAIDERMAKLVKAFGEDS